MSNDAIAYFVYQKDFSERGADRYFVYESGYFEEVDSLRIASLDCFLVTHDYWLIANSIYKTHQCLPRKVIDIVLLSKIIAGTKAVEGAVQRWDISKTIRPIYGDPKDFDSYEDMYYRRRELDLDIYMLFAHKLAEYFEAVSILAAKAGETERLYTIELPIFNVLTAAACRGIRIDNGTLRRHKEELQLTLFRELKSFAEKHNVLYEVPNEGDIREKLSSLGYDVGDYALDFLIDFLPSKSEYTEDLRRLQKVKKSYGVFNSISYSSTRLNPIVESSWTSTSRIYHKSPSIQNISRKYRDIFIPDSGMSLCYVDYDQFEIGVMASLSGDANLKRVYQDGDAYKNLAVDIFNDENKRKKAKLLFISFTYGMAIENILCSIKELGGNQGRARNYFAAFKEFEAWKKVIHNEFQKYGRIGTICGNYLNRQSDGELTEREKRMAVNHVAQGTATYIFKNALLQLGKHEGVELLIPMHDAVLFQHSDAFNPSQAINIFQDTMTNILGNIKGKASLENFFEANS
jgi:DNA polymerase I